MLNQWLNATAAAHVADSAYCNILNRSPREMQSESDPTGVTFGKPEETLSAATRAGFGLGRTGNYQASNRGRASQAC